MPPAEWKGHTCLVLQIDFAEELLRRHLLGGAQELVVLCQESGAETSASKEVVRVLVLRVQQCLSGARSGLPELRHAGPDLPGEDLSVTASVGFLCNRRALFVIRGWP